MMDETARAIGNLEGEVKSLHSALEGVTAHMRAQDAKRDAQTAEISAQISQLNETMVKRESERKGSLKAYTFVATASATVSGLVIKFLPFMPMR
ncbi:hypothetical protein [Pseudovibrio sp. SPO723]|uniref:hypothetical protein n=1 Tax=Nesiotobacter zosterae TaxID=392721 RepID=UPI0029C4C948|nr:hypothetical protein [Pseudovibrio sp. SPO723]MDX5592589.1 hypothetical protein [Pseudovibrio sp. SPO723]